VRIPTSKVQNNFGKYLKFAKDGLDIIVTKNGHDIAKLTGIDRPYIIAETMGAKAEGQVTYEEFRKMDQDDKRYELIDG